MLHLRNRYAPGVDDELLDAAEAVLIEEGFDAPYDALVARGETYLRSTVAGLLAETMLERGAALEEVEQLGLQSRRPPTTTTSTPRRCGVASAAGCSSSAASTPRPSTSSGRHSRCSSRPTPRCSSSRPSSTSATSSQPRVGTTDARSAYEAARDLAEQKGGVVLLGAVIRRLGICLPVGAKRNSGRRAPLLSVTMRGSPLVRR